MGTPLRQKIHLLVIDPQIDFCDQNGALYVAGADEDIARLTNMVNSHINDFEDIHATMDSHHEFDVAHPIAWLDANGTKHPDPFTCITKKDVQDGVWKSTHPGIQSRWLDYVTKLEANGRYPLVIWPPHCLIGHQGHTVVPSLWNAFHEWEKQTIAIVDFVTKGSNPYTEHYSAVMADVPDDNDPTTQLNTRLIQTLQDADVILLAGEALSHCVANTVTDIANNFGESNIRKLVLLRDACSSVGGFEQMGEDFITRMSSRGMQVSTTVDFWA